MIKSRVTLERIINPWVNKLLPNAIYVIREQRKLRKLKHSYLTERTKQKKHFLEETAYLNNLLANNAIDLETYSRLKKLLVISYQRKREETRKKHGFTLIYCVFRRP